MNKRSAMMVLTIVLLTLDFCCAEEQQTRCDNVTNCHECIQTPTCAWCEQLKFGEKRCFQYNNNSLPKCDSIINPIPGHSILEAKNFQKASKNTSAHDAVQIYPQKVALKLRINEAYRINVNYLQAEDYPVDLYYLMDLSGTMDDDKDTLEKLGHLLVESMQNTTSDFRIGFGHFIDKFVLPFANKISSDQNSSLQYGYYNQMPLDSNVKSFSEEVKKSRNTGNTWDDPEGGFDGIMQAIVCNNTGWREKARKLLVFSTDGGFHYAGDGKLGGILKPNDGQCHLNKEGYYTESPYQDYPSIAQINLKARQRKVNIIFAVTANQKSAYKRLSDHIDGASVCMLSNNSDNIVQLIQDQYGKISSSVEMTHSASSDIQVTYYSTCLNKSKGLIETRKCDGLKVGTVVSFQAEIKVTSCPPNKKDWNQTFQIYPVGINEALTVEVQMQCDCACKNVGSPGSLECRRGSTMKCGICECDANNSHDHDSDMESRCKNSGKTCSNRGSCNKCGQCDCIENKQNPGETYYGTFCECDDFSCDRSGGALCSGHGKCECGVCKCNAGWEGLKCDCHATNETCIMDGSKEICSGHGTCKCGHCICHEEGNYSGKYCQRCPTCSKRCQDFKNCVQCLVYKTGPLSSPEECEKECTIKPLIAEVVEVNEDEILCEDHSDSCSFAYVYTYNESGKIIIRAQKELKCPTPVNLMGIILSVIGAILLIGMFLLLLWKLLTEINDRRDYAKFQKDGSLAKWDDKENPIYKIPNASFENPMFMDKSKQA